jgi:D-glycero-D-manno-heptose 1,7-bisphosphate phosphatase
MNSKPALRPAVFVDRDGTLNVQTIRAGTPFAPQRVEDFALFPGVTEACAKLAAAGFVLVVATNQPDIGRGTLPLAVMEAMHAKLRTLIPQIARIEVATAAGEEPGQPPDRRRKPEPGMLLDAAATLGLDLARSWMVGDRWRDVDCGKRAGVQTVFIDFDYDEPLRAAPDFRVRSFAEAARIILARP